MKPNFKHNNPKTDVKSLTTETTMMTAHETDDTKKSSRPEPEMQQPNNHPHDNIVC